VDPAATDPATPDSGDEALDLTALLARGPDGGRDWSRVLEHVYGELKVLARHRLRSERAGHSLDATGLVHEAYLRLLGDRHMDFAGRRHFFGAAARAMQRVLIDRARRVGRQKRGGDRLRVTLGVEGAAVELDPDALLDIEAALEALEAEDPRAAEVARLRLFAGLELAEIAAQLDVSERTAAREWAFARAHLGARLDFEDPV
jgi:RNA polymerase sigma factor (TIGR02999 family)